MQIYMYAVMYVCNYVILYVCVCAISTYIYIYIHMGVWNITKKSKYWYWIYHISCHILITYYHYYHCICNEEGMGQKIQPHATAMSSAKKPRRQTSVVRAPGHPAPVAVEHQLVCLEMLSQIWLGASQYSNNVHVIFPADCWFILIVLFGRLSQQ